MPLFFFKCFLINNAIITIGKTPKVAVANIAPHNIPVCVTNNPSVVGNVLV